MRKSQLDIVFVQSVGAFVLSSPSGVVPCCTVRFAARLRNMKESS